MNIPHSLTEKKGKDKPENHFQYITSQKSANSVEIGTVLAMFCLQKTGAENWVFLGAFDFLSHSYKKWTLSIYKKISSDTSCRMFLIMRPLFYFIKSSIQSLSHSIARKSYPIRFFIKNWHKKNIPF